MIVDPYMIGVMRIRVTISIIMRPISTSMATALVLEGMLTRNNVYMRGRSD